MTRSLRLVLLVVLAASAAQGPALARPTKIALTRIAGDTSGLDKAVAGALDDTELEVVSGKQVARAIDRLGLPEALGDRDLGKLAAELEVDAIVKGAFDRRGHKLKFTIFSNGKNGKPFSLQVANADSARFRKLVRTTMVARLASAVPAEAEGDDRPAKGKVKARQKADEVASDADDDKPVKAKKAAGVAEEGDDKPAKAKKAKQKAEEVAAADAPTRRKAKDEVTATDDSKPAERPASKQSDDDAPRTAAPRVAARDNDDPTPGVQVRFEPSSPGDVHSVNLAAVRVDLGASMSGRSLQFKTTAAGGAPRPYTNQPVPGARVAAELYPLALIDPGSPLAGFGIAADYDQVISLTLRASNERTVPLKAAERHYAFGARYRLAFGHWPTSPTLTLGAGYGARTFAVDRSGLMTPASLDLPDVDYRMFDPGLAFRLPIGDRFAITLGGEGLLVTRAGAIQRADQYGKARVLGATASAGAELMIDDRVAIRIAAEATQIDFAFAGTGALATSRDGNSSTIDVRGATDRYYGGVATVAVTY